MLIAVDVATEASRTTARTLEVNCPGKVHGVVQTDLLSGLRVRGGVDVLVFNPPYVPTEEGGTDSWAGDLEFSWSGGGMGMKTTIRVLDELSVLSRVERWGVDGRIY